MDAYTAAMQGTCEDAQYWDMYQSYHTDNGGSVLAGPGLEWSPRDHPQDALEVLSHSKVWRCRLLVPKPELKACLISALETQL